MFYGGSVDCLLDRNNSLKALFSGQGVGIVSENNDNTIYNVLVALYR